MEARKNWLSTHFFLSLLIKYQRTTMNERGGWIFEIWQRCMYACPLIVSFSSLWIFVLFVCVRAKARVWTCTECRSNGVCVHVSDWIERIHTELRVCVRIYSLSELTSLGYTLFVSFHLLFRLTQCCQLNFFYRVKWTIPIRLGHGQHKNTHLNVV